MSKFLNISTDNTLGGNNSSNEIVSAQKAVKGYIDNLLKSIYPVGSLYFTVNSTCPLAALFGTWQLVAQDKVLQGAGTRGSVGTTLNESLPNIKGKFWSDLSQGNLDNQGTGAFAGEEVSSPTIIPPGGNVVDDCNNRWTFDASRSSSTYQDNAPVQQDAYLINVFKRTA